MIFHVLVFYLPIVTTSKLQDIYIFCIYYILFYKRKTYLAFSNVHVVDLGYEPMIHFIWIMIIWWSTQAYWALLPIEMLKTTSQRRPTPTAKSRVLSSSTFRARRLHTPTMGHSNVWNSHPKTYGPGSRTWLLFISMLFNLH